VDFFLIILVKISDYFKATRQHDIAHSAGLFFTEFSGGSCYLERHIFIIIFFQHMPILFGRDDPAIVNNQLLKFSDEFQQFAGKEYFFFGSHNCSFFFSFAEDVLKQLS
jgi:hypothetical protein